MKGRAYEILCKYIFHACSEVGLDCPALHLVPESEWGQVGVNLHYTDSYYLPFHLTYREMA